LNNDLPALVIKIDAGGKGIVEVNVNDKRTDVRDNRPSQANMQRQYSSFNGDIY
jgi:hypothetical protein